MKTISAKKGNPNTSWKDISKNEDCSVCGNNTCRNSAYSWNNPSRDNYFINFRINKRSHLAFRSCQEVEVMSSSYQVQVVKEFSSSSSYPAGSSSCRAVSS